MAAASPFFQNILKKTQHPHPLIYMRALKLEDLVAIVDFLYYGEANVFRENLDSFLVTAEEFSSKDWWIKTLEIAKQIHQRQ